MLKVSGCNSATYDQWFHIMSEDANKMMFTQHSTDYKRGVQ